MYCTCVVASRMKLGLLSCLVGTTLAVQSGNSGAEPIWFPRIPTIARLKPQKESFEDVYKHTLHQIAETHRDAWMKVNGSEP